MHTLDVLLLKIILHTNEYDPTIQKPSKNIREKTGKNFVPSSILKLPPLKSDYYLN